MDVRGYDERIASAVSAAASAALLCAVLAAGGARAAEVYVGASFTQSLQRQELHGVGVVAGVLFDAGGSLRAGPEVGWTSLGTTVTDVDVPGTPGYDRWREEFTHQLWHATANLVWRRDGDGVRPYARAGVGALVFRTLDEIRYFDAGVEVPSLHFEQNRSETRPGADLGVGARVPLAGSGWGLGLEGRWRIVVGPSPEGVLAHHLGSVAASLSYDR
jgi:hypothetical protein